jgi:hypothetical protein
VPILRIPTEPLLGAAGLTLGDFWAWAYSDLPSNANRSVLGEFIVGAALGCLDAPREEWAAYDLKYSGKKIEVKTSGNRQSWDAGQTRDDSTIIFGIAPTRPWDTETYIYGADAIRSADCYVFCVYHESNRSSAHSSILNLDRWKFYVVPTSTIDRLWRVQKTIRLSRIESVCSPCYFDELRGRVDTVLELSSA